MVSIELLRKYPFFGRLSYTQLKILASIAEEITLENWQVVIEEGKPAKALFFLMEGSIDLFHLVGSAEIPVCEISPGEPFGISALIEPHVLTSTARSSGVSQAIRLDMKDLKAAFARDAKLECMMIRGVAEAAMGNLNSTHIQLAAAYA